MSDAPQRSESDIDVVPAMDFDEYSDAAAENLQQEPSDGIDLMDGLERDYESDDRLDFYELEEIIDNTEAPRINAAQLRAAEEEMDARDAYERIEHAVGDRTTPSFMLELDRRLQAREHVRASRRLLKRSQRAIERAKRGDEAEESEEKEETALGHEEDYEFAPVDLADVTGSVTEFLSLENVQHTIQHLFAEFLTNFRLRGSDGAKSLYTSVIEDSVAEQRDSLAVDMRHLIEFDKSLSLLLVEAPSAALPLLSEAAAAVVFDLFPGFRQIHSIIKVCPHSLPFEDHLRALREAHLNRLVRVSGVVTRRTSVFPKLLSVKYVCTRCGSVVGPVTVSSTAPAARVRQCPECHSRGTMELSQQQTVYENYQRIGLQERPGDVQPGRIPMQLPVILIGSHIDSCRPGEEIEVTGIFKHTLDVGSRVSRNVGFPLFSTVVEAQHIKRETERESIKATDKERRLMRTLAAQERVASRIFASVAPSIHGQEDLKVAICLALFGGTPKEIGDFHRIRGDINVLAVGDPGTAKSQLLKYAQKVSPRAIFTSGKGASAVGLTAAVKRDPITGEFTLEGGALVLADRGVCLIDEFDKMSDQDRVSIHEAMEQQTISISKAGIVASLQARCSVVAAANPTKGRYDSQRTFAQNVDLSDPILSRFDILCVVRDIPDYDEDLRLAQFVVGSHRTARPIGTDVEDEDADTDVDADKDANEGGTDLDSAPARAAAPDLEEVLADPTAPIPHGFLKKYIAHARTIIPRLSTLDMSRIESLYVELRQESQLAGSLPVNVRLVQSIVRIAEASARMHLRHQVIESDIDFAVKVVLRSFIAAQKASVRKTLEQRFRRYIQDRSDTNRLLSFLLGAMVREQVQYEMAVGEGAAPTHVTLSRALFEARAREKNIFHLDSFYESPFFVEGGYSFSTDLKTIEKEL
eukprot:gnl/Chilomastix_cuspidata/1814.p1 GENE.gnl/Chilomastix_cuspidata/1814~~gnl/Chilomastix_cuspidata/1814.p1  ORF type:complete len:924 (+),score=216.16 gnl/Chilomastix_cuspidata/1814:32-2803(+)